MNFKNAVIGASMLLSTQGCEWSTNKPEQQTKEQIKIAELQEENKDLEGRIETLHAVRDVARIELKRTMNEKKIWKDMAWLLAGEDTSTLCAEQNSVADNNTTEPTDTTPTSDAIKLNEIEIQPGDFNKLVPFIEKHGFVVTERGVPSDHQYTFFDSNKNRYAFMTIKRDQEGKPSTKGEVTQISTWAYRNGIKDQEHYFGFLIDENSIKEYGAPDEPWAEKETIQTAYQEFLDKVNNSSK